MPAAKCLAVQLLRLPLWGPSAACKKLLMPLAYGAADVDLITGTESSPNITQSETFTTANPENPDQIVVAYNDSRGAISIRSTSPALRFPPTVAPPLPASRRPTVKAPSPTPLVILLFSTTRQPTLGSRSGSMRPAAVRAWAGISPPPHRTPIAGPISAFTPAARTTENPATPTTTHLLRSSGECTSPGTTLIWVGAPISVVRSSDNGVTWSAPVNLPIPAGRLCSRRPDHRRQGHGRRVHRRHG